VLLKLAFVLFVIGTVVLVVKIFFSNDDPLPWLCPRCGSGGDEDAAGMSRTWYATTRTGYRCRTCGTYFKEHPNGTVVEDRDR
jgi:hypothetical protein